MSLSEIPESEAAGRIAEIYRAILAATGLPSTNLVWRHMASRPGVLEWAYDALEAGFSAGAFRSLGAGVAAELPPAAMPKLAEDECLDRATLERAASVMAFYNRANPINLVALCSLRRVLAGETSGSGNPAASPAGDGLPALPPVARDVDPETRARMAALARTINDTDGALMPTALRHLANWPPVLAAFGRRVEALAASGALDAGAAAILESAAAAARRVPLTRSGSRAPGKETRDALEAAIDLFVPPISRMIVVGHGFEAVIRAALDR
ncbi:MAG: hypothetical protein OXI22_22450 [Defluviicoccus sp.]|nr:hypothetical protein [Defluviicoccus sp.]MDE0386658.1 hypothetical protein [Defluviicoccus sp.]